MTRKGVWNLQQVRDKYLQSLWVNSNQLMVWGSNSYGGLGLNAPVSSHQSSPTQIPGTNWSDINPTSKCTNYEEGVSFAIKDDGTLWAWGRNNTGQLGQNSIASPSNSGFSSPVQVGSDTTWAYADGGNSNCLAIKTDGTAWAWGNNYAGKLGLNNRTYYSSPVQIPGTNWSVLKASKYESFGVKTDGTLWSWGYNNQGQLGLNNKTTYSSPTQIPGTTWSDVDGSFHMVAAKTDGTLWSWGYGGYGELGQNDRITRSSPVQIPGTNWSSKVFAMYTYSMGMKTDGTLWLWGQNNLGQLGQNDRTFHSSPVQVGSDTNWANKGGLGNALTFAFKTDNTLWSWGYNGYGRMGTNQPDNFRASSPVQVPGTWTGLSVGVYHVYGTKKLLTD